ncbi:HNH endonuclease family protein [Streptomyces roseoverticillatus]|uniref:HNH endonuclease family protein n=1 Tax=Streptomyces roseoverticillatus TaxID=66429 RepID=UPI001F3377BA|nr:HNH endonuclease family protein [Streptomyces roseoverticillatus]
MRRRRLSTVAVIGTVTFAALLPGTVTYAAAPVRPAVAQDDDDVTCEGPDPDESPGPAASGSSRRLPRGGGWAPAKWPTGIPNAGDARNMLGQLIVADNKPPGYHRSKFRVSGSNDCWIRQGDPCCTTRQIVLKEQSTIPVTLKGKCEVVKGNWTSEYDSRAFAGSPKGLDIDHIVPLKAAWDAGADTWDVAKRERFANDISPGTPQLIAVSATSNRSKGDKRPDQWMPPDPLAACPYGEAWIAVKHKYDLTVTRAEGNALARTLDHC